jgi:PAS domain S-box-containing protein
MDITDKTEKLKKLINLWSHSLSAGPTRLFSIEDAPYICLEMGKAALEKLREEGVELIRKTPLETMNAVYTYFVEYGYFKEARVRLTTNSGHKRDIYELYEKDPIINESDCHAFLSGRCISPACMCHNIMRYALISAFTSDLKVINGMVNEKMMERHIKIKLIKAEDRTMEKMSLMEGLKKEQGELMDISERYRRIIEMSLDAIVSSDESGRIILWNPAAERMFGYTKEEALGMYIHNLIPDEFRERHRRGFERFIKTQKPVLIGKTVEVKGLRKDGSIFPEEISLSADRVRGRWVFTGIMRDITERKKTEGLIMKKTQELESVFENAPIGLGYLDKEMRIIRINPFIEEKFGVKSEEIRLKHCYDVFGKYANDKGRQGRDKICDECQVIHTLRDGRVHIHERKIASGYIIRNISAPIRDENGNITGVVEMIEDITPQKELEDKLRQRLEEVERINKLMVGRELKMGQMKEEIRRLKEEIRRLEAGKREVVE